MKRLLIILSFVILVAGCRHADRITVEPEETNPDLEVTSLLSVPDDTTTIPIDSSALLPSEQSRFAGVVLLNSVRHDAGGEVRRGAFSWVYFADRVRPFMMSGQTFGYYGIALGSWLNPLLVNAQPMLRIPHKVRAFGMAYNWGYEYIKDMATGYQPNSMFRWQASADTVGLVDVTITSPDSLQVLFPKGGMRLPKNRDAILRWVGQGNFSLVISVVNPLTKRARPLLHLRPRENKGSMVISQSMLATLATKGRYFAFSFVLANRKESTVVTRYTGGILVQAAEIYNSYIELI